MLVVGRRAARNRKAFVGAVSIAVMVLLAGGCSSGTTDRPEAIGASSAGTATPVPEAAAATATPVPTTMPVPTATPIPTATPVPAPTEVAETATADDQQLFCTFMATRYFWEPNTDEEFLALVPDSVPTSVMRPFRASEILAAPGLGDPRENSLATMVLFTAFASDLGRYLEVECPGVDWIEIAVAYSGDPDFEPVAGLMQPSSSFDLCAVMERLDFELDIGRSRRGPIRPDSATAVQRFASAIDPEAPFEVLAFSHQLLTQVTLSRNQTTFDLYVDLVFDEPDLVDVEAVSAYFDQTCPTVRDTRLWLTAPRAAGAVHPPRLEEGLPDGWETVPAEDVRSSFGGDLRTLPVGEFTPLLTSYPNFDNGGVGFTSLGVSWVTESIDPAQASLFVGWLFDGEELPFDVSQAVIAGPDGTRYVADAERSFIEPGFAEFVFALDFIPETLESVGFGIVAS